jgi:hypothetical protein
MPVHTFNQAAINRISSGRWTGNLETLRRGAPSVLRAQALSPLSAPSSRFSSPLRSVSETDEQSGDDIIASPGFLQRGIIFNQEADAPVIDDLEFLLIRCDDQWERAHGLDFYAQSLPQVVDAFTSLLHSSRGLTQACDFDEVKAFPFVQQQLAADGRGLIGYVAPFRSGETRYAVVVLLCSRVRNLAVVLQRIANFNAYNYAAGTLTIFQEGSPLTGHCLALKRLIDEDAD